MRLLFILLLLGSLSFSIGVLSYGSGTIQDCLSYTHCNVTQSSTITDTDFSLSNHEIIIYPNVTVSLLRSRLLINATERLWIQSGATINASGNGRSGGSGGISLTAVNRVINFPGVTNGSNGTINSYDACTPPSGASGSGLRPFEYLAGVGGVLSGSAVTGGGFYATGAVTNEMSGGSCSHIYSGGSGQAIRLMSFNLTNDGSIYSDGAPSVITRTGGTRGAAGSGGGEVLLYSYNLNVTGTTQARGSTGATAAFGRPAGGGAGGIIKFCGRNSVTNSTIPSVSGGSGARGGSTGATGQVISTATNSSCFPDVITDIFADNGTNHITNNPATLNITFPISVGVFNSSNVSCASILDGVYTSIGQFNATGFTNSNVYVYGASAGLHNFSITCGNSSVGIANHTTTVSFAVTNVSGYTPPFVQINSPTNGSEYINPFPVTLSATVQSALFSSCTAYINNVSIGSFTGSSYSNSYSGYLLFVGTNSFTVSCTYLLGGTNTSSVLFSYASSTVTNPFEQAFGLDIGTCPLNTYNHLVAQCLEYYKTPSVFNFSAVPCRALNLSLNYSCLSSLSNVTKVGDFYNYTIFYTPSYWNYSGAVGIPNRTYDLTGAEFIYNNDFVTHGGGIELIDNNSFMYVPAQHKPVDCGYYYTGFYGTTCSYGYGFIVNNRIVMVADSHNQWYTAAGVGIANNSLVPGQPVIYVNVIPLPGETDSPFDNGIYTRYVCSEQNGSYIINMLNSVQQTYTLFLTYNISGVINQTSISSSSNSFNQVIPLTNLVNLTLYDSNGILCKSENSNLLFLPFNIFNGGFTDGFSNMFIKIILLFTVVISAIIPYALIITVILNDVFHVLSVNDLGVVIALIAITSIVNNIFATEKGIKNMVLVMALCISYLMLTYAQIQPYLSTEIEEIRQLSDQMTSLMNSNDLASLVVGVGLLIVNLFVIVLKLPAIAVTFLKILLFNILPSALFTPTTIVLNFVWLGASWFYYLKAYEVITNRFRGV